MPCYNGEKTIERAINGVINQTYRPIELILVNDGSTDNTHTIIQKMCHSLEYSDIEFVYIMQENMGLGGAINTGLQNITGDYIAWIDADDELLSESTEKKVRFLQDNAQYGCVSTNAYLVNGDDWGNPIGLLTENDEINYKDEQFEYMLMSKSIFCCGCHLVRTEAFDRANPARKIYPARHGQNWQMLLPVYYHYKRGFIDEPLYKYGIYGTNMSAQINLMNTKKLYERREEYIKIIHETLLHIPDMDNSFREDCEKEFKATILEQNIYTAIENREIINYVSFMFKIIAIKKFDFHFVKYPIKMMCRRICKLVKRG